MCPTDPRTTMSTPFIEIPQREEASPRMTTSPPRPVAAADWLALPSTDHRARHDVLGHADAAVAVHAHGGLLVHAGAVVADVPVDVDLERRVEADRDGVAPAGVAHAPAPRRAGLVRRRVQPGVELAQRRLREVDDLDGRLGPASSSDQRSLPHVERRRRGLPHVRVLGAGQHRDGPVLRRHRHPVVGLGEHGGLAGDRIAQDGEAVGRADREREEAVEVAQAALERLAQARPLRAGARSGTRRPPRCRCRSGR